MKSRKSGKNLSTGRYIIVNGIQGAGKDTQIEILADNLRLHGIPVHVTREPGGADLVAKHIRKLTQDPIFDVNTKTEVLLYNASRSQTLEIIKDMIGRGVWVISNYNYLMTLAVQYYAENNPLEYQDIASICEFAVENMEGDVPILIDLPSKVGRQRKDHYAGGERFDSLSIQYMERIRQGLLIEAKKRGHIIVNGDQSINQVSEKIWEAVLPFVEGKIPDRPPSYRVSATSVSQILADKKAPTEKALPNPAKQEESVPLLEKEPSGPPKITEAGREWLKPRLTNIDGNVYAFKDTISPITVAASMARLSRRGDDLRVTLLDEFVNKIDKDESLLSRVITAYGDDSVQQLVGIHVVVESASNLLTKKLEWGRLASYLEQSTRYIYFDQKDERGNYKYFTPRTLDAKTAKFYEHSMNTIFEMYSEIVRELTEYVMKTSKTPKNEQDLAWKSACRAQACDAARPLLPVATKSTVGIFASGQAIEGLIMRLQSDELEEAKIVGNQLLKEARSVIPVFLERADRPDRGGAWVAYRSETNKAVKKLAKSKLQTAYSNDLESVKLIDVWPKNEMDLLPHMLFEHSNSSLEEIKKDIENWSYDEKLEVFKTYIGDRLNRRHKPGRALEQAHYSFELVCDYGIFRDLQRHRMVDALEWQILTPRYGYEIPKLVEETNLAEKFEECFELSLKLHGHLQSSGYELEAQYATLLGHKMRWKMTYNAREAYHLHELRTTPHGHPGYRKLVKEMHEKVANHHPLLAEGMRFVNKDEDPELTRLAAERYTQWKLSDKADKEKE